MTLEGAVPATLWALCAAGLGWYALNVARQITYVTLADGRKQERRLPFLFRLVLPLAGNLSPLLDRPSLDRAHQRIGHRLVAAGYEGLLAPGEFLALRALVPLVFGSLWLLFVWTAAGPATVLARFKPALCLIGLLCLYAYPGLWLRQALAARHKRIQRAMPFTLDLLTLSVEAGMDFMNALQRNVNRRHIDALSEELIRVVREIQIGKTRRQALLDMGARVRLPELRSVVQALVQADELGVSIGAILRIQADQIRQRRFERAERLANEAPVKMLFPLMLFIFPAVFLVLLGPIFARLLTQGF